MPKVDQEKCIGCGTCVVICPDCFFLNEEGKVESSCGKDCKSECNFDDIISACPVDAISK